MRSGGVGLIVILVLVLDNLQRIAADGNLLRLHRLRHFAHQIDYQQAIGQVGVLDRT